MRRRWSRIAAVVSILVVVLGATACSGSGDKNELLIYNAQHESLTKEWIDAFTKQTGVKVTYRQGGDTELGNQLVAEGVPVAVSCTLTSPFPRPVSAPVAVSVTPLSVNDTAGLFLKCGLAAKAV